LDRLAFADAPLGLPDGLAAALATWGLALGLEARFAPAAVLLGLAAAARPNDGLACLGLLVAWVPPPRPSPASRGREEGRGGGPLLACGGAAAIFLLVAGLFFALGGRGALRGFLQLRD